MAQHRLHRHGGRGVAEARGVVDVVGAQEARGLLGGVVHLVGDAARGQIEGDALSDRLRGPRRAMQVQRVVPGDDAEPALARRRSIGSGSRPSARSSRDERLASSGLTSPSTGGSSAGRGVQPHQLEAHHAEVRARQRPVAQARCAQRAAVADAVRQDAPGERQLVAVLPGDLDHLAVVVRLLRAESEKGHVLAVSYGAPHMIGRDSPLAVRAVDVVRRGEPRRVADQVAVEEPLEVRVNGAAVFRHHAHARERPRAGARISLQPRGSSAPRATSSASI